MSLSYKECEFNNDEIKEFKTVCDKATQVVGYYAHPYAKEGNIRGLWNRWFNLDDNKGSKEAEKQGILSSSANDITFAALAMSAFPNALEKISQLRNELNQKDARIEELETENQKLREALNIWHESTGSAVARHFLKQLKKL